MCIIKIDICRWRMERFNLKKLTVLSRSSCSEKLRDVSVPVISICISQYHQRHYSDIRGVDWEYWRRVECCFVSQHCCTAPDCLIEWRQWRCALSCWCIVFCCLSRFSISTPDPAHPLPSPPHFVFCILPVCCRPRYQRAKRQKKGEETRGAEFDLVTTCRRLAEPLVFFDRETDCEQRERDREMQLAIGEGEDWMKTS